MALTLGTILRGEAIDPGEALAIRHSFVAMHEDGEAGIHADSTDAEILAYTSRQSLTSRHFPADPPRTWLVFVTDGSYRARLWRVLENHGEVHRDDTLRHFDLRETGALADLQDRLVIHWPAPITWRVHGATAADYPVLEIADAAREPFPGFDRLRLSHATLQAVLREHRYEHWRSALSSVAGIYLITDTRDGRQYVGKADGAETIRQRWSAYAADGHGGNVGLRGLDPSTFRYSVLRVFDRATPQAVINDAESHFKQALDTTRHGLNGN